MKTILEYLIDGIRSTYLYEMAEDQSRCEDRIRYQSYNILENLVLIHYFRISGLPTYNIEHWKDELETAIYNASRFELKKNNSEKRRERLVRRVFDEKDMKKYDSVYHNVYMKISKEKETLWKDNNTSIPKSQLRDWLDEAIISSINQMDDIIELIVKHNPEKVENWVEKL